jgi:4-amino-4-deoxy-L-arabinose transferase-like glycosyltransferase
VTAATVATAERRAPARLRSRIAALPRALWACVAVGVLNAAAWAMITPVFQVPDEPVHIGYAQYVAETASVPRNLSPYFKPSEELERAFQGVPFTILGTPTWSAADDRALDRGLERRLNPVSEQGAGYAAPHPPLYYVSAALAYEAAGSGSLLDRIMAMRLLSALFAGLTVAFAFLFLRELLPRPPWLATVGALTIALNPMFAFVSGGVNPDSLLYASTAALLWLLARGFRRGLSPGLGMALGLTLAVGVLAKGTVFAFLPGVAFGVAVMVLRARRGARRPALAGAGGAAAGFAVPFGAWLVANTTLLERESSTTAAGFAVSPEMSLHAFASYAWGFYLPRLPGMQDWFPQLSYPVWDTYFRGLVGRFGWFEWGFPEWVSWVFLALFAVLVVLAVRGLLASRQAVRARAGELLTYAALAGGLLALITVMGYRYIVATNVPFEQARYLLPLIPLYAALVAFAVRSAGPRFAAPLAALVVVVAAGHNIFAQLLSLARYYA